MGYFGDFESQEAENRAYEEYVRKQKQKEEPDVVPCYQCGDQMYEESSNHEENICDNCLFAVKNKQTSLPEEGSL